MKCWKCGRDAANGADKCLFCGVSLRRTMPTTPAGKAMRTIYDQVGMEEVLNKRIYLTTALGDLLQNSQKLRNQLGMAMDSGMGSMYLTQLKTEGKPTSDFRAKVKRILTEDAGLSDKIALELIGYMDEMIGWQAGAGAQKASPARNREQPFTSGKEQPRTPGGEQPRTPGGKKSHPQHAELEKLKAEAYQETCRINDLLQKLMPLKYNQALQKEATDIYDQLTSLNKSFLDMMLNINNNLNLPSPNPDAVTYARGALRVGRLGIDPLEKQAKELFQKAATQNTATQNTATQNTSAQKSESNDSGCLGLFFILIAVVALIIFCPAALPVVGSAAIIWFLIAFFAALFKKK